MASPMSSGIADWIKQTAKIEVDQAGTNLLINTVEKLLSIIVSLTISKAEKSEKEILDSSDLKDTLLSIQEFYDLLKNCSFIGDFNI